MDNNHSTMSSTLRKTFHYLVVFICLSLASCADLVNDPVPATPQQETSQPEPGVDDPIDPTLGEADTLCEEERRWAYHDGIIDYNALKLYRSRNYAPIFNEPGVRQSGIDGWIPCLKALQINGFVDSEGAVYF